MSISVVIPCFNGADTLQAVLAGVGRQSLPPDEVLVVDDGSEDRSPELGRSQGARVVRHPHNRGLAAARNTGIEAATSEVLIFVDSDAIPHPDLVRRLSAHLEDPAVGAAGGQVMELGHQSPIDRWRALFWRQTQGPSLLPRAALVVGACCGFRRQALLDAGGFSPAFRTNGEDVEISIRLRRQGLNLVYDPLVQVFHLRRDSLGSLLSMVYRHNRDQIRALRQHGEPSFVVVQNALRWGPVSLLSSLRRHNSPALAGISPLCQAASLAGCAAGYWGGA